MSEASAPFSIERFRSLLGTAWVGRELRYEPAVDSTMDEARSLAGEGAPDGAVVLAQEQRRGRGRLGRHWLSPRGANLYFSILLYPTLERLRSLAMVTPLAVVEGLQAACGLQCTIKWPNDVQVNGRKLAGVLLESELSGNRPALAIAGVGINVNYDPSGDPEIADIATSVMLETAAAQDREAVLARCLDAFERWYESPLERTRERWRSHLTTLGNQIRVTFGDRAEEGLAEDVTEDGSLVLLRGDGSRVILPAGEVSLRT